MAQRYVAFIRGINLGGNKIVSMKDLARMFERAGCTSVRTHINSGNVIFSANQRLAARIPSLIESAIQRKLGFTVSVVTRSQKELAALVRRNPFIKNGRASDDLLIALLLEAPSRARIATLDPQRSPPGQFAIRGRDLYLKLPDGVAASKLSNAYFETKLQTVSTVRNWRTIMKLLELMQEQ